jgi:hypothetical protein
MTNYEKKYLKYKQKYLELKRQIGGNRILFVPMDTTGEEISYNQYKIKGRTYKPSDINSYFSKIGALSTSKQELINHLNSISRCFITDNDDGTQTSTTSLIPICSGIAGAGISSIIVGLEDAQKKYAFMDIDFRKSEDSALFINFAISDTGEPGKGVGLVNIAYELAKSLGITSLRLVPTPNSKRFWTQRGFIEYPGFLVLAVPPPPPQPQVSASSAMEVIQ